MGKENEPAKVVATEGSNMGNKSKDDSRDNPSPLKDAQNLLGFLLAGFAGVVGFLGLRSDEVTTVLRNDTRQATVIAFILLLAALAAVIGVAVPKSSRTTWACTAGTFFLLFGLAAFVIYNVPVSSTSEYGKNSLYAAYCSVGVGIAVLIFAAWLQWRQKGNIISGQFVLIMASIILLATSMYGAMRLETYSQRNPAVQIAATAARQSNDTTLSVRVTASKLSENGYIGVAVEGLKTGVPVLGVCQVIASRHKLPAIVRMRDISLCTENPCSYLKTCVVIFGGVFPPDPRGNVDETLDDMLISGQFEDITVRGSICHLPKLGILSYARYCCQPGRYPSF